MISFLKKLKQKNNVKKGNTKRLNHNQKVKKYFSR